MKKLLGKNITWNNYMDDDCATRIIRRMIDKKGTYTIESIIYILADELFEKKGHAALDRHSFNKGFIQGYIYANEENQENKEEE